MLKVKAGALKAVGRAAVPAVGDGAPLLWDFLGLGRDGSARGYALTQGDRVVSVALDAKDAEAGALESLRLAMKSGGSVYLPRMRWRSYDAAFSARFLAECASFVALFRPLDA